MSGTQSSSALRGSSVLLFWITNGDTGSKKESAGPGSNGNFSAKFKKNYAKFPLFERFPPALINAFAFQ